jgi:hypothetical protein
LWPERASNGYAWIPGLDPQDVLWKIGNFHLASVCNNFLMCRDVMYPETEGKTPLWMSSLDKQGFNKYHLPKDSACCEEVRRVSNMYMGMHYVVLMLSPNERKIYSVGNILKLIQRVANRILFQSNSESCKK